MTAIENRHSVIALYCETAALESHLIRLVVAEKDIAVDIEYLEKGSTSELLSQLNPYNSLPTLVDRELVLYDYKVIVDYLDERYPHPPFMPIDPVSRARTRLTLFRIKQDWYSLLPDLESGSGKKFTAAQKALRDSLVTSADVFAAKTFFLSDEYSILDATLAPMLWRLAKYGIDLGDDAPAVVEYARRIFARPGFQASLTEIEREMPQ